MPTHRENWDDLTRSLMGMLQQSGAWPEGVTRIEASPMVDSLGDDALSVEIFLSTDDSSPERIRELSAFWQAVRDAASEVVPDLFPFIRMSVETLEAEAGAEA